MRTIKNAFVRYGLLFLVSMIAWILFCAVVYYEGGGNKSDKGTANDLPQAHMSVPQAVSASPITISTKEVSPVSVLSVQKEVESHTRYDKVLLGVMMSYIDIHNEPKVSEDAALHYISFVKEAVEGLDIDPIWIIAMMWQESRFQANARSGHGAIGLMQIMPRTGEAMGLDSPAKELYTPKTNIQTGIKYLAYLLDRFDDLRLATLAYNQGEGRVSRGTHRTWYYADSEGGGVNNHYKALTRMVNEATNQLR